MFVLQEHVVHFVVKLLSPPIPTSYSGPRSHLVDHMPMLSAVLFGVFAVDTVHILSLHGVVSKLKYLHCFQWFYQLISGINPICL